ncbi:Cold shock-like protein CspE (CSP-E) [Durusdinium trenchii]|uniref:Cold shock-like protein CspE (CSP-E) n=1 Tax=Durusdinium trenchii TaxID=1381693 RepID=A0ABP0LTZ0_9DINO
MEALPPQPPPPPPPGGKDVAEKNVVAYGYEGAGFGGNGGYYPPPDSTYGYPPGSYPGYPAGYPPPPGYGNYGPAGGYEGKGAPGAPPPPPQGGAPGYGTYEIYGGYGAPPRAPGFGFDGKGRDARDGRQRSRDGRESRDERRRDDGRRDGRAGHDKGRDYDRGDRGRREGREGGKGFDGYGRGVPLPDPVELELKGLPMDASEPALRSLFQGKGLHFDSVQFSVSAIVKVSGHQLADQVISTFHKCPIAGKPIDCVRLEDTSGSRPRSRRRERTSPPRRERTPPPRPERRDRSRTPPRGRDRSRSRRQNDWGDKGGGRGGGGSGYRDEGGRLKGAVLKFDEEKGFGFIKPERGNEDIFVHFTSLPRECQRGGSSVLRQGDRVSFDLEIDPKKGKPCAKNVQLEGGAGGGAAGGGGYVQRGAWGGGAGPRSGSVSNWDSEKGFGFITPDGGDKDLFMHFSSLPRSYQRGGEFTLQVGDRVSFDIEFDDRKGKNCAKNVQVQGGSGGGGGGGGASFAKGDKGGKGGGKSGGDGSRSIMSAERRRQLFDSPDDRSPSPPRRQRFASRGSSRGSRSPARRPAPGFSNAEPGNATGFGNGDFRGASDGRENADGEYGT